MNVRETTAALPLEHFVQAITSQLDRAQTALALKARAGLPLTFAVKDLTLDLRTVVEMDGAVVKIRPASSGDPSASTLHLAFTTITRPMMEENALQLSADRDEPTLNEMVGEDLSQEDLRRLEWAGVQTVSQLVALRDQAGEQAIERVANVPALRLRAALDRASRPMVREVETLAPESSAPDTPPTFNLRGRNLLRDGPPTVRMDGTPMRVLHSAVDRLVVQPISMTLGKELEVETAPGMVTRVPLGARRDTETSQ